MIKINSSSQCCACSACANICPQNCITMQADEEGFLYPKVDQQRCINCGLCEKVCPILHLPSFSASSTVYAAKSKDISLLAKSSSGGLFSALAISVLKEGGIVFGAAFDKNWNVHHQSAQTLKELDALRRSKYVQSNIGKTFQQAKQFLDAGRPVFFTGTPCQIAGLKNYLGKEYENLLTADIICHGVPSPAVWQKFLDENFSRSNILSINFRDKFFGWRNFYLSFLTSNGRRIHADTKQWKERLFSAPIFARLTPLLHYNIFLKAFLKELINRPSCHQCHFKGGKHWADFTMGDLWGNWPESIVSKQDKKQGISALLVSSDKGLSFLKKLNSVYYIPISLEKVNNFNSALSSSTQPHPKRSEFFERYKKEPLRQLIPALLGEKPFPILILQRLWGKVTRMIHFN